MFHFLTEMQLQTTCVNVSKFTHGPEEPGAGEYPRTEDQGPAVFYLATCVSVSKFKLMTVSL